MRAWEHFNCKISNHFWLWFVIFQNWRVHSRHIILCATWDGWGSWLWRLSRSPSPPNHAVDRASHSYELARPSISLYATDIFRFQWKLSHTTTPRGGFSKSQQEISFRWEYMRVRCEEKEEEEAAEKHSKNVNVGISFDCQCQVRFQYIWAKETQTIYII